MIKSVKITAVGALIGMLGGLIGLGGAEFRLPLLVGTFGFGTFDAVIINKILSLIVVGFSLPLRSQSIPWSVVLLHWSIIINLLSGSIIGAWVGAHYATKIKIHILDRLIMILLITLAIVMIFGHQIIDNTPAVFIQNSTIRFVLGILAGVIIGAVAAVLGVAGGELIIPTLVLLFGLDIKIAGSLSLCISLPTMVTAFVRYSKSGAIKLFKKESKFLLFMAVGSIIGSAIGGKFVGLIPSNILVLILGLILFTSAIKTFKHSFKKVSKLQKSEILNSQKIRL